MSSKFWINVDKSIIVFLMVVISMRVIVAIEDYDVDTSIMDMFKKKSSSLLEYLAPHPDDVENCKLNYKLCDNLIKYPTKYVDFLIETGKIKTSNMPQFTVRGTCSDTSNNGYSFCSSSPHPRTPYGKIDESGSLVYILQSEKHNFTQKIVENVCSNTSTCLLNTAAANYKNSEVECLFKCSQQQAYKTFLGLTQNAELVDVALPIDTCCQCRKFPPDRFCSKTTKSTLFT